MGGKPLNDKIKEALDFWGFLFLWGSNVLALVTEQTVSVAAAWQPCGGLVVYVHVMNVLSAQIEKLLNGVGIRGGRSLYILPSGLEIGIGPIHVNKSLLSKFGEIAKLDVGAVSINKVRFKLPLPWISPTTLVSISGLHIDVSNTTFAAAEQDIGDSPKLSANDGSEKVEPPKQGISPGAPNFVIFTILATVAL